MEETLRILLVDDERLILNGISELIEGLCGPYRVVGTAVNGRQGLELVRTLAPDVVFLDVKMPAMDGLEMAARLRGEKLDTEVILLSAYQDFEYAQQGIALGVAEYVLKHELDEATLSALLNRLWLRISQKRESAFFSLQSYLTALLNEYYIPPEVEARFSGELPGCFSLLLLRVNRPLQITACSPKARRFLPVESMINRQREELQAFCVVPYRDDSYIVLLEHVSPSRLYRLNRLRECADRLTECCRNKSGGTVSIAAVLDALSPARLAEAARCAYFHMDVSSVRQSDSFCPIACHGDYREDVVSGYVLDGVLSGTRQPEPVVELLEKLEEELCGKRVSRRSAEGILFAAVQSLEKFRTERGIPSLLQGGEEPEVYWARPAIQWLRQAVLDTFGSLGETPNTNSRKLKAAAAYIQSHCGEDLTQQQVAEALGFSGVYLSVLFRREFDTTFLEFLTNCRMERAKHSLVTTDKKIYEIARETGYMTSQYFSRLFRKHTGMTPGEFREKGGETR